MPLTVYAASFAVAVSLPLLWWSLSKRSTHRLVRENLGAPASRAAYLPVGHGQVESSRLEAAGRLFARMPGGSSSAVAERLARAGLGPTWSVGRVMLIKVALAGLVLLFGATRAASAGGTAWLLASFGLAAGAFMLPDAHLAGKARERQAAMELQLPDLLDQVTVSIEAGLGFDSALARVVQTGEGPVYDEFAHVLQDMRLGVPREAALDALAERTTVSDLRQFIGAVSQAGRYGLPLGDIMRVQAAELRDKRKFRAEERALKIPVKMLVPLLICVLPALFIVLLGPTIVRLGDGGLFGA
jgi:tight adherence protein C